MIESLVYQISYRYLKPFMSYRSLKHWTSDTHVHSHTRKHTHTSECQRKITFFDVLDYSEYSDISRNFFLRKHSFFNEEAKQKKIVNIFIRCEKKIIEFSSFFVFQMGICPLKGMTGKFTESSWTIFFIFMDPPDESTHLRTIH